VLSHEQKAKEKPREETKIKGAGGGVKGSECASIVKKVQLNFKSQSERQNDDDRITRHAQQLGGKSWPAYPAPVLDRLITEWVRLFFRWVTLSNVF
jgi:hypothetical protein